jgi:hypothetical protein
MTPAKINSILSVVGFLLLLIAIIGGFFTLGKESFGYFPFIALAGLVIQIWVYSRKKQI